MNSNALVQRTEDSLISSDLSDTETVMLDPTKGSYFGVSDVAKVLWVEMAQPIAISDLCTTVSDRFDVGDADVQADTIAFVQQLIDAGLARIVD